MAAKEQWVRLDARQRVSKRARGGKVRQDPVSYGQGSFPATHVQLQDALYLFRAAAKFGLRAYQAVLSRSREEVARVEDMSVASTTSRFDPKLYSGPLKAAVDAWVKLSPRIPTHVWP